VRRASNSEKPCRCDTREVRKGKNIIPPQRKDSSPQAKRKRQRGESPPASRRKIKERKKQHNGGGKKEKGGKKTWRAMLVAIQLMREERGERRRPLALAVVE